MDAKSKFDCWHAVEIPDTHQKWFHSAGRWPVHGIISLKGRYAQVHGGEAYRIHVVKKDTYEFYRVLPSGAVVVVGSVDSNRVWRAVSEAAEHDLKVFRTILFGGKYPGPLAYRMAPKGDLVHVGECFKKHESAYVKNTLYSVKSADWLCSVCGKGFID